LILQDIEGDIDLFDEVLYKDDEVIRERLRILSGVLREIEEA
jgi:hypothetical protein